jgi:hypothetical protein
LNRTKIAIFVESHHPEIENENKIYSYDSSYLLVPDEDAIEVRIRKKYTIKEIQEWYDKTSSVNENKN